MRKNIYFAGHMEIDFENKEIIESAKFMLMQHEYEKDENVLK